MSTARLGFDTRIVQYSYPTARILLTLYRHQKEVQEFFSSHPLITHGDYLRVMALGCLDILVTLPLVILGIVADFAPAQNVRFWPGWAEAHAGWIRPIERVPAAGWHPDVWTSINVRLFEWVYVLLALVNFLLFGLTQKARARYARAYWAIARPLGFKRRPTNFSIQSDIVFASNRPQTMILSDRSVCAHSANSIFTYSKLRHA